MPPAAALRRSGVRASRRSGKRTPLLPEGLAAALQGLGRRGIGLCLIGLALLIAAALLSYHPGDPSLNTATGNADFKNLLGRPGAYLADLAWQSVGLTALLPALLLALWGWRVYRGLSVGRWGSRLAASAMAALFAAIPLAAVNPEAAAALTASADMGGAFGALGLAHLAGALTDLLPKDAGGLAAPITASLALMLFVLATAYASGLRWAEWRRASALVSSGLGGMMRLTGSTAGTGARLTARGGRGLFAALRTALARRGAGEAGVETGIQAAPLGEQTTVVTPPQKAAPPTRKKPAKSTRKKATDQPQLPIGEGYTLPPTDLLQDTPQSEKLPEHDKAALEQNAEILLSVLDDFGVKGDIGTVSPGPVVTLYELEPAPGTKSSRVIGLSDDIARSMSAISVRVAVIPGKNAIGIELPNSRRETVFMREMLETKEYGKSGARLPLILGKNIGGDPVIADLARMPHLLVAGTTGSGKSVSINTMLLSLLYRLSPEQVRLIMVDPKMLELSVYDGIPHLLAPVVTEPKKAVVALRWAVREMEDRYRAMSLLGVRNIDGYNQRIREAKKTGETMVRKVQTGYDAETGKPVFEDQPIDLVELPYIVIVVDEFADLMVVAGKEIEAAVQRLAQMARAAGIHLIMATQRPSVDVITGTIKANFPTRISFAVTSKIDSRTILGEGGAEDLLGMGDMLYMGHGGRLTRVHGPFVADEEVEDVVAFLRGQGDPDYVEAVTEDEEGAEGGFTEADLLGGAVGGSGGNRTGDDGLFDQAVAIVARDQRVSTSYIQRQLGIGYNKAANIVERMEAEGMISAPTRTGKREVLLPKGGGS